MDTVRFAAEVSAVVWFFVILAVLIVFYVVSKSMARKRGGAMRLWADRLGLSFRPGADGRIARRYLEFQHIGGGGVAVARNQAEGTWRGREVHVFDLVRGPEDDDEKSETRRYTCAVVKATHPLIPLLIRPETIGDRLSAALGNEDINFESAEFSQAFHVASPDRKWAYDVLHPRQMDFLLSQPRWHIELAGWFCLVAAPPRLAPDRFETMLETAAGVLDNIPDFVRREIMGQGVARNPEARP